MGWWASGGRGGSAARVKAYIRVSTLPPGIDPDEVVSQDAAGGEQTVAQARPVVVHVMETLATGRDLEDPKVRSEIAAQVLPLIEDVPNPIERETYRQRLARLLHVDERALLSAPTPVGPRARPRSKSRTGGPPPPGTMPETVGASVF